MLWQRVLSGAVGLPVTLFLVYWGREPFAVAIAVLACIGLYEFYAALKSKGIEVIKEVAYPCLLLVLGGSYFAPKLLLPIWQAFLFVLLFATLTVHIFWRRQRGLADASLPSGWRIQSISATVLGTLYVSLFCFAILLRTHPAFHIGHWSLVIGHLTLPLGARLFFLTLLTSWATDSAAYFVGKIFGARKLAPQVSPGKTIEGSFGGFVGGVLAALALGVWLRFDFQDALVMGVIISIAGQIGDLCKSVIKRDLQIKDFGKIIPGHGGVLDRFDSLLINAPLIYFYAQGVML